MTNTQIQPSTTNTDNSFEVSPTPKIAGTKSPLKSNKRLIVGVLLALPLVILVSLAIKEYLRASEFTHGVSKVQSSSYYKDYLKNTHTYLESNNGAYVNYRSCNVTSTDSLWSFKQPEDAEYYYSDFSMIYNGLEGNLRGEQTQIKKNLPAAYKKNPFSGIAWSLNRSVQKRQQIVDLTSSMNALFNSNDYVDYCGRVIYQNTINRLSRVKVNADGSNTVVSGPDTEFNKKQADELAKTLEAQKVPAGLELVNEEFITTIKAIAATYGEVSKGTNITESAKMYRQEFQAHKTSLDKNLTDLAAAAKQKIATQPNSISKHLKAAEE